MPVPSTNQVNFREYLRIIFRRKQLFIIPLIIVALLTVGASFILPRIYESSTLVLIGDAQLLGPLVEDMAISTSVNERLDTLREEILSWTRLIELARNLNLDKQAKTQLELEGLLNGIRKNILVKMQGKDIIKISYQGKIPFEVQKVANTITQIFIDKNLADQAQGSSTAIDFVESQLDIYQGMLEESEKNLREFKEKYLLETPGEINVNLDRLVSFETSLIEIGLELKEAKKKQELLKKQLSLQKEIVVSQIQQAQNPVIAQLNEYLVKLETQLATLLVDAKEEHPTVKEVRREIKEITNRIKQQEETTVVSGETSMVSPSYQRIQDELNGIEVRIDSLEARRNETERLKEKYGQIAKNAPQQEQELISLTRDRDVYRNIYNMLLNKLETARISQRLEFQEKGRRFLILDSARLPLSPIKPNKKKVGLMGLVLGMVVGAGCVYFAEYVDHSFRGIEDAKSYLDIPYLGAISHITVEHEASKNSKKAKKKTIKKPKTTPDEFPEKYIASVKDDSGIAAQIVSYYDPTSIIAEQYRILRTKIQRMTNSTGKPIKVISLTSVTHQEGKTVTSVNLAVTLAKYLDKKILLMDCDLRRGTVHKFMGIKQSPGLSEILSDNVKNVIQNNKIENLDIISCGQKPKDPSELLSSPKMEKVLKELREEYDYIVLDAPPILPVTDAEIIAPKTDGVIMIIRSAKTQREAVVHAETLLKQAEADILGFVLTHVKYYVPQYLYRYLEYPSNYYY